MKKLSISFVLSLIFIAIFILPASAAEYKATVSGTEYKKIATNTSYSAKSDFKAGSKIEITSEKDLEYLYIVWYQVPDTYTVNGQKIDDGFLHKLVKLDTPSKEVSIELTADAGICFIKAYANDEAIPEDIQEWRTTPSKVDVMYFSCHADDESLFFGASIATILNNHPDAEVQLVYMTNHKANEKYREHERLDAMWALGLKNYPIVGEVADAYATTLEGGIATVKYDELLTTFEGYINDYQPKVVITQDINGEYGHGQHMVMTKAVIEAVETCAKEGFDVPKLYVHLAEENQLLLDCRVALDSYGGKTAVDVAKEAYKKHVSQQYCWFYVTDNDSDKKGNLCNCAKFGLYRTTVGTDTEKDMLSNIKTYKTEAEEEAAKKAEEAKKQAEIDAANKAKAAKAAAEAKKKTNSMIIIGAVAALGLLIIVIVLIATSKKRNKKKYVPRHGSKDRGQTVVKK